MKKLIFGLVVFLAGLSSFIKMFNMAASFLMADYFTDYAFITVLISSFFAMLFFVSAAAGLCVAWKAAKVKKIDKPKSEEIE